MGLKGSSNSSEGCLLAWTWHLEVLKLKVSELSVTINDSNGGNNYDHLATSPCLLTAGSSYVPTQLIACRWHPRSLHAQSLLLFFVFQVTS